ncbi:MAG: metallophosphoesterase family protein [Kiritimatiellia bacterium]
MDQLIAVISDIHSNLEALNVVLNDAKTLGVTNYICVGDIVGYNARPNECCDIIRNLGCVTVCGNHDHYTAANSEDSSDFHPLAAKVIEWTRQQISPENLEWLRKLPYSAIIRGITVVHATLDGPEHWGYVFEAVEAEPSFAYQHTQLCFHGHTHVPAIFEMHAGLVTRYDPVDFRLVLGHKYFVNIGSVGQPRDGDPRASYCIYNPVQHTIHFRRLNYDVAKAQQQILDAGLPRHLADRLATGT